MAIPTAQLVTWSHRPASSQSAATRQPPYDELSATPQLGRHNFVTYLQGSYANATNIRFDSDVDVMVELQLSWRRDLSLLTPAEEARYQSTYPTSQISWTSFRQNVLAALRKSFGANSVSEGNKCLKVAAANGRLPADLLVAQQYRLYTRFPNQHDEKYVPGVIFRTQGGREVINYPRMHRVMGTRKQEATGDQFKRLVRTVKNARRRLVSEGTLTRDVAPSYFVEGLVFNLPDGEFEGDLQLTFLNLLAWAADQPGSGTNELYCVNCINRLFGPEPEQWDVASASQLVLALLRQWRDW